MLVSLNNLQQDDLYVTAYTSGTSNFAVNHDQGYEHWNYTDPCSVTAMIRFLLCLPAAILYYSGYCSSGYIIRHVRPYSSYLNRFSAVPKMPVSEQRAAKTRRPGVLKSYPYINMKKRIIQ